MFETSVCMCLHFCVRVNVHAGSVGMFRNALWCSWHDIAGMSIHACRYIHIYIYVHTYIYIHIHIYIIINNIYIYMSRSPLHVSNLALRPGLLFSS